MRLLNTKTLRLEYFHDQNTAPKYAILSHTWGDDEILFADLDPAKNPEEGKLATTKYSLEKVLRAAHEALSNGYTYIWIDSCCIDKSSSAELSEAINSMFSWYAYARECYAYLSDITIGDEAALPFVHSRWFTRGWTLQELIAPSTVIFYDSEWKRIGTRTELAIKLATKTKIPVDMLSRKATDPHRMHSEILRNDLDRISVSTRMLWAENRRTTRVEDRAYSLMGIFDVNMPLLYGEGPKAFTRLQEIILTQTNDQSILAFAPRSFQRTNLAPDPQAFVHCLETYQHILTKPMTIVSGDIEVDVLLCSIDPRLAGRSRYSSQDYSLAVLDCNVAGDVLQRIAILLKAVVVGTTVFTRVNHDENQILSPVCFKLQLRDDGNTWAVPATHGKDRILRGLFQTDALEDVQLAILDSERTRIVIKPSSNMSSHPGRHVPEPLLQISLQGPHSDEFQFVGEHGQRYETQNNYIRADMSSKDRMPINRTATLPGGSGIVDTGMIRLIRDDWDGSQWWAEGAGERLEGNGGFNIMWGHKFSASKLGTSSAGEAELVCYVFPRPIEEAEQLVNFTYNVLHEFQSKAASVSLCWNKELQRGVTATIWAKTVLDRKCAFMTLYVSGASDEERVRASDEGKTGDDGKAGDGGSASD